MITIPQRHRQTDGGTDEQLAMVIPRSVQHRAVKTAVSFIVCEIQAVLMLRTTFLSTLLVFDLEFVGHVHDMSVEFGARIMGLPY